MRPRLLLLALLALLLTVPVREALHASSVADTVYVDPQAGAAPLVAFITAAQHTLDGEVYLASSKPVLAAIEAAAARHVTVRINLEQHPYGTGSAVPDLVYKSLAAHGVQVRWTSRAFTYTHAKYLIADQRSAWIGTMNWTTSAFASNREFGVVDTDATVVRQSEAVFTADWAHTTYTGSASALVLSPTTARPDITAIIAGAKHTIDMYVEEIADKQIVAALVEAAHRGVKVRIVAASAAAEATLRAAGVQVLVKKSPYIHAKAIVADGSVVFIGSENISSTSLDKNREIGLVLHDSAAINAVEQTFAQDIGGAPSPVTSSGPSSTPTVGTTTGSTTGLSVHAAVQPNPTSYGTRTSVQVTTAPGAACTVKVVYASGTTSTSKDLGTTQTAAGDGTASWTWTFGSRTAGTGHASVTCTLGAQSGSDTASFTVT